MGYVLRVRLSAFFAGAAAAAAVGLYVLHNDYKVAHRHVSEQMTGLYESLEGRISALEQSKEVEPSNQLEAAE
ncbi:hypothetical protein H6P81_001617 [Aristolochia fimbriata]|uniref:Uncharacterized protein n=1 Tax=Aristolochia fimbriata TaxID=158543 RepID=A0AAV7F840_ARIFI|nr:hypothetical protein H6P81_001617 [Aristolochia fimbriata]